MDNVIAWLSHLPAEQLATMTTVLRLLTAIITFALTAALAWRRLRRWLKRHTTR